MTTYLMLLGGPDRHDLMDSLDEEQRQQAYDGFLAFAKATAERGTIVAGDALGRPESARTVHPDGTVTDGPFAESVEQFCGFYVVDLPTMEDAVELAKLLPEQFAVDIRAGEGIEIR